MRGAGLLRLRGGGAGYGPSGRVYLLSALRRAGPWLTNGSVLGLVWVGRLRLQLAQDSPKT